MTPVQKSGRILLATFVCYGVLVATNLGEFWPFSIYPMFSQAGNPWSRSVVRLVPADTVRWAPTTLDQLPGDPYPLADHGVDHIDLGSLVAQTGAWTTQRMVALRDMLQPRRAQGHLLVMRVGGRLNDDGSVVVTFSPDVLLTADRSILPDTTMYFSED